MAFPAYRAFLAFQGVPCPTILVLQGGTLAVGVLRAVVGVHPVRAAQGVAVVLGVSLDQELVGAGTVNRE